MSALPQLVNREIQNLVFVILGFDLDLVQFFLFFFFLLPILFRIEIFTFWHCVLVDDKSLKEIFYRILQVRIPEAQRKLMLGFQTILELSMETHGSNVAG